MERRERPIKYQVPQEAAFSGHEASRLVLRPSRDVELFEIGD